MIPYAVFQVLLHFIIRQLLEKVLTESGPNILRYIWHKDQMGFPACACLALTLELAVLGGLPVYGHAALIGLAS